MSPCLLAYPKVPACLHPLAVWPLLHSTGTGQQPPPCLFCHRPKIAAGELLQSGFCQCAPAQTHPPPEFTCLEPPLTASLAHAHVWDCPLPCYCPANVLSWQPLSEYCCKQTKNTMAPLGQQMLNLKCPQEKAMGLVPCPQSSKIQPRSAELNLELLKSSRKKPNCLSPSYVTVKPSRALKRIKANKQKVWKLQTLKKHQFTQMRKN